MPVLEMGLFCIAISQRLAEHHDPTRKTLVVVNELNGNVYFFLGRSLRCFTGWY